MAYYGFAPYVPVASRRAEALREAKRREKSGEKLQPVQPEGRQVAKTVWGKAWCDHLESHSDYSNRLPRGRTYVRNGSVIDLKVLPGSITALVSGSSIYRVRIDIEPLAPAAWQSLAQSCAGQINSLVELLSGRLDKGVMARLCHRTEGLFPRPRQMKFACSCPDGAVVCKHVAAAIYGVGHRLDTQPELLFALRQVDQTELVRHVALAPLTLGTSTANALDDAALMDVFGLDFDAGLQPTRSAEAPKTASQAPKPATQAPKPVTQGSKPATQAQKPVTQGSKPATQAPKPVTQGSKPATQAQKPGSPEPASTRFVLSVLAASPDLEFSLDDLFAEQTTRPKSARKTLRAALDALVADGRALVSDVEDGVEYWALA